MSLNLAIINTIWNIFTLLFLLYKFTSFFSHVYNFTRFCGKLWIGSVWVKDKFVDYIRKKRGYIRIDEETPDVLLPEQNRQYQSPYQKIKNSINTVYNKFFSKPTLSPTPDIPLNESYRESYIRGPRPHSSLDRDFFDQIEKKDTPVIRDSNYFESIMLNAQACNYTVDDSNILMQSEFINKNLN